MNVLIYIPDSNQAWGGIRQYAVGLINILAIDKNNIYYIYHNANDQQITSLLDKSQYLHLVKDSDVDYKPYTQPNYYKRGLNALCRKLGINFKANDTYLSRIDLICDKYKIDIIHCPYQFIPKTNKAKLITTLHDVQELHFPEFFTPEDRAYRAVHWLDYLKKANRIVVSYNHVKLDIVKYFLIDPQKIEIILLNMGKLWFEKFSEKDILSITKFNIPEKFIFYPANTWKHKNHIRLLKAISILKSEFSICINIVCSGHLNQHYYDEIEQTIDKLDIANQIFFVGIVSEQELYSLYKTTLSVIVPTLYEAGSFPLMESILLGVPAVCSNVTSLPETINNEICLFDPFDENDIANVLKKMWESSDFRQETTKSYEYSSSILRETGALEKILKMYEHLMYTN